jgi:hypothetical protein
MEHVWNWLDLTFNWDWIEDADKDSGISSPYVYGLYISHVGGRKCSVEVSDWLLKRMGSATVAEVEEQIIEEYY